MMHSSGFFLLINTQKIKEDIHFTEKYIVELFILH